MIRRLMILVAVAVGLAAAAMAADADKGKAVFDGAKPACKSCHTDAKNPLAKAGAANSTEDLKAWVRTPKDMMAKRKKTGMMPAFGPDKISDADLDALVAYLATMK
jgi:mono/diheme cytochrome c family protein